MSDKQEQAMALRRQVVGDEYVDRWLESLDEFTGPIDELITGFAWGSVWSRPGLDRAQRSLITLAMLAALNRPGELEVHIRGAVNNGCSKEQIIEALLQTAVYAGIPAARDALLLAREVLENSSQDKPVDAD